MADATIIDHYKNLVNQSSEALDELSKAKDIVPKFAKAHQYTEDLDLFYKTIKDRPEHQVLKLAIWEFQFALLSASCARYRHAYISLRLFFELSLSSVLFSAHELNLHMWLKNSDDINWRRLTDPNNGVFAKDFVRAFCPAFEPQCNNFRELAEKVYRECSEYVHGNYHTHPDKPKMEFDRDELESWFDKVDSMKTAFTFAFAARHLELFSSEKRKELEPALIDTLGTVPAIAEIYGLAND